MSRRSLHKISENEVTSESHYRNRRQLIQALALSLGGAWMGRSALALAACDTLSNPAASNPDVYSGLEPNSFNEITSYNNYYEFSTDKQAVKILAQALTTEPWTLEIEGEVEKPMTLDVDQLLRMFPVEERIYRLRCVEGWSMVIPWTGFPLCQLIKYVQPTQAAKYVEFIGLHRPSEMINQRQSRVLSWPYREALRIDEATHPLSFMVTGLYGEALPKQNGAPLRLAVPWKYGYKSAKGITRIRFLREQPISSWMAASPSEYGFFANVNPHVAHPRWSQRREVRIGELRKIPTRLFNGYAEEVAYLYKGMNLELNY